MADPALLQYIRDSRKSGLPDANILNELEKVGWKSEDVRAAFLELSVEKPIMPPAPADTHEKSLPWKWITLASVLFLVSAGGAYGAYYYYELPSKSFLEIGGDAENVESFAYELRLRIKTFQSNSTNSIESFRKIMPANVFSAIEENIVIEELPKASIAKDAELDIKLSGSYENNNNSPKLSIALNAEVDSGGTSFKVGGEFRAINKVFYIKLTGFPAIFGDISELAPFEMNRWYSLAEETLSELGFELRENSSVSAEAEELKKKIREIAARYKLLDLVSAERDELADGTPAYRYVLKLRKEDFKNYLKEISKIEGGENIGYEEDILNDLIDSLSKGEIKIAVERDAKYVREFTASIPEITADGERFLAELDMKISGYNNSSVRAPDDATPFDPILKKSLEEARIKARDARRAADLAQIRVALELHYDANKNKYPPSLMSIFQDILPMLPRDPLNNMPYAYYRTSKGYHVGASLELKDDYYLLRDADSKAGFNGSDSAGCSGEKDRYCYDFISI